MPVSGPRSDSWSHALFPLGIDDFAILVTGLDRPIYAIGSRVNAIPVRSLSECDASTSTRTTLASDPTLRSQPAVCVVPEGRIYVEVGDATSVAFLVTLSFGFQAVNRSHDRAHVVGGSV